MAHIRADNLGQGDINSRPYGQSLAEKKEAATLTLSFEEGGDTSGGQKNIDLTVLADDLTDSLLHCQRIADILQQDDQDMYPHSDHHDRHTTL